ncbi:MAG TPA: PH domain-containing protein [Cyclobacteriaceae bacterium]|nr:PH domain-containing protein [Cyclobacteriaceae bacterium]
MMSEIIHKSKIGHGILAFLVIVLGSTTAILIINQAWIGLIPMSLVILLILNIYTGSYYKITKDNRLIIKCGIVEMFDIDIKDIISIRNTNAIWSAPALSLDRLEINYKGGCVLVSPKDKKKFIDDLKKINPRI